MENISIRPKIPFLGVGSYYINRFSEKGRFSKNPDLSGFVIALPENFGQNVKNSGQIFEKKLGKVISMYEIAL